MPYGFGSSNGECSYILKTSSRWKDSVIGNLEIFIRTDFNTTVRFLEDPRYPKVRSFDTMGESKVYNEDTDDRYERYIYEDYSLTTDGYLYKNVRNFIPDRDISFRSKNWYSDGQYDMTFDNELTTIYDWSRYIEDNDYRTYFRLQKSRDNSGETDFIPPSPQMLKDLSVEELRILRNTLYAMHGYVFSDAALNEYYNRQYWYFPKADIALTDAEQQILQYILAEESQR